MMPRVADVGAERARTPVGGPERDETTAERADRNWNELLQELRVMQTGSQIMVGFLLTIPFQARFTELDDFQRGLYLLLVGLAALATLLIMAPVSMHRLLFAKHRKPELVSAAAVFARAGLVSLGVALCLAVLLLVDVVATRQAAWFAAGAAAVVALLAWAGVPVLLGRRQRRPSA